jgi:hypothetical protein
MLQQAPHLQPAIAFKNQNFLKAERRHLTPIIIILLLVISRRYHQYPSNIAPSHELNNKECPLCITSIPGQQGTQQR